ncbi:MAG: putative toxin-antitoxin system toxin component, PIN family [Betaproteobacteria bacterium]|jgi:putative PIN family toxin of toxin-antitoxin system|nr:putative toxin-antitoxin system toxin component, PIN family [Betaproteobacteria bacterium]
MPRRLVLDSNIWLDWLVFGDGAVVAIRNDVGEGLAEVLIDPPCLDELARVLAYPLQRWTLDAAGVEQALATCRQIARLVQTPQTALQARCADGDDQKFLELAAGCGAYALVTRDRELLRMARNGLPFHIVTPAAYAALPRVESAA